MPEATSRLTAALADRYKIERKLGEGGMASVYLAQDLKHERKVALKILRPELAAVIGAERFLSEIKTTANLQHPHILALFDSGEADGFLYYVMPFIDGETLREKLEREQQLGVDEAVKIARDVADALDYAHRHDVIHRDIKPANILLHDGRPVVADFGIALAISAAGGGRMTETGLSLGTPHYMSPEQASADRDLSARSDVYSLGCVLYEMLAGQPPHTGPSAQSILVRILTEAPRPVTELRHTVPPHIAAVVTKSIEKLPADRFESAREFLDAMADEGFEYAARQVTRVTPAAAAAPAPAKASRGLVAATGALAATTLLFGWMALGSGETTAATAGAVTAFVLDDEYTNTEPPIVGPDGAIVIFRDGMLHLRAPGSLGFEPLEGTEGARFATFSPDGEWLAFGQRDGQGIPLKRMPARGGPVTTLWSSADDFVAQWTPAWGDDGFIYFDINAALVRIPEEGGPADTLLVTPDVRTAHITVFPGGRGLAFTIGQFAASAINRVILMDLETRDTTTLVADGFHARYVNTGHLLYAHDGGALYAMPFDAERLEATGAPVPVVDDLATSGRIWGRYDVSPDGTLVYLQGDPVGGGQSGSLVFALADPGGGLEELPLDPTDHADADLSADGRMLTYIKQDHVWVYDLELGTNRQLTTEGAGHHNPIWSPDRTEVVFRTAREGDDIGDLYVISADGSGPARRIGGTNPAGDGPAQWLDDGTILFDTEQAGRDIYRIDAGGDSEAEPVLQADWVEINPRVSPDGRWLAFVSSETGPNELYVRRWPELTGKIQITSDQGFIVPNSGLFWSEDGRRLYVRMGGSLWEATFSDADEPEITLRDTGVGGGALWGRHPDGRILTSMQAGSVTEDDEPAAAPRMVVVSNWLTALGERLGSGN